MGGLYLVRSATHGLLWMCAVVLLGLTAYRVHYTKRLALGDILSSRRYYYDNSIAELLATSALTIIGSLWFLIAIAGRMRAGGLGSYAAEQIYLWIIWVMFLVGASIVTHDWRRLGWCRGQYKACSILETIKAFSWICFILVTFLILMGLVDMFNSKSGPGGGAHGRSEHATTYPAAHTSRNYPETRGSNNPYPETRVIDQEPVSRTTETTYTEVRNNDPNTVPVNPIT